MANLLLDDSGRPKPQVENAAGTGFEAWKGENNAGRITGDIDHDAVDAGKPVKVGGKAADPAALPADVAAGDRVNALFDLKGRLFTRMDIAPPLPTGAATEAKQDTIIGYIDALKTLLTAIKDSEKTYSYANVTGDTQIKAGAGKLKRVIIGKVATAGNLTLYDGTTESGTTIAVLSLEQTGNPRQIDFDITFSTGLYAGFDASLAGNITIIYE